MKKDLSEWIDKEVERLDQEIEGKKPEGSETNPAPDALREALGSVNGKPREPSEPA
jgi:hypothetical protein